MTIPLPQNREPSFRWCQRSFLVAIRQGPYCFPLRRARFTAFGGEDDIGRPADDFRLVPTQQPRRAQIPGGDASPRSVVKIA
jgi:hypothetical protein